MIDLEGSDETSILASEGPRIFSSTPTQEGETLLAFSGDELLWNNKLRCHAITNGIDRFVPQIFYLIRPETAFTSCLHFLAKEIGGIQGYENQRQFIIRNPGLTTLMPKFWQRVQNTSWSGGFGIPKEDTALLLLALMECFSLTLHDPALGPKSDFPCPHLPLTVLHEAGIYLPSIEYPEPVPTPQAHALLTDALGRANLPGTPSDLTSYIDCFVCGSHTAQVGETNKHKCIPTDQLKCTGCGLVFANHDEYKIHALTFCRMGPTSQGRCSCCNVKGPQCLCQQHWRKTYTLVESALQGNITRAEWLTPEYVPLLIDASVFLDWPLTSPADAPAGPSSSPTKLRDTLWDPTAAPLPTCIEKDGECLFLPPNGGDPASPERIQKELESFLGIEIKPPKVPQPKEPGNGLAMDALRQKFLGTGNINVEDANADDFEHLEEKITRTSEKLSDPKKAKVMASVMKKTVQELHQELKELKELQEKVAMKLFLEDEQNDRKERLHFRSPITSPIQPILRTSSPVPSEFDQLSTPSISPPPRRRRSPQLYAQNVGHRVPSRSPNQRFPSRPPGKTVPSRPPGQGVPSRSSGRRTSSRSPGARTATSVRGSSKTHTILMELQHAMSVLRSANVDPNKTSYKRKYGDLKNAISKADQHQKYDSSTEVDPAYSEDLEDLIVEANDLLDTVDEESDRISADQAERRRKEAQIAKCLPRSQPQKWDGSVNDFIRFKTSARVLMEHIPNPRLALNAIIESISDPHDIEPFVDQGLN